ncbi:MAG: phosphatidylinositol mannoside acyltransferase, partial [Ilumatobacteraceae bacterium]
GNGCIFALPHLGGWEWAGRWMTDQGFKLTVVVEALEPPELFEWFADLRKELGMTVVPTGPKAGAAVMRALRANEIVCLLCDRDIERNGVEVEFFGEVTTLPAGPATLGLRIGSPILPVGVYFTPQHNGHHALVRPPVSAKRQDGLREDVLRVTQSLARELEFLIRRAPEQWHLFQPNWPSDPGY